MMTAITSLENHRASTRSDLLARYRQHIFAAASDGAIDAAEVDSLLRTLGLHDKHLQHDISVVRTVSEKEQAVARQTDGEERYREAYHAAEMLRSQLREAEAALRHAEDGRFVKQRLRDQVDRLRTANPRIYGGGL